MDTNTPSGALQANCELICYEFHIAILERYLNFINKK
jgi:hypothetical protein